MFTWNPYISEVKNGCIKSVSFVTDYAIVKSFQHAPAPVSNMTAQTS